MSSTVTLSPGFPGFRARVLLAFGVAAILLASVAAVAYRAMMVHVALQAQINASWEFISSVDSVLGHVTDAETGERGFVLSGNHLFLDPYYAAVVSVRSKLLELKSMAEGDPRREVPLAQLERAVQVTLSFFSGVLRTYQDVGADAARALIATGEGRSRADRVRELAGNIARDEAEQLQAHQHDAESVARTALRATAAALLFTAGLLIWVAWLVMREITRRATVEA